MNHLVEILTLKLICLIMQQKQISKNTSLVNTSSFALESNLASLEAEVDKLDIDKLVPIPVDLSKLYNVVKDEVVKKTEYNAKIKNIEDKIPDITNLGTKTS